VSDRDLVARCKQLPEFPCVLDLNCVDNSNVVGRRNLDQTQVRSIAIFGDKLGVEADRGGVGNRIAELGELLPRRDVLVLHFSRLVGKSRGHSRCKIIVQAIHFCHGGWVPR
jgi:hypothetical protein